MSRIARYLIFSLAIFATRTGFAVPAFPGAEGFGADTVGGRGGTVYHVTTLADSGAGSLRTGVGTANRTIVFDVSGTISLSSDLVINKNNLTIAGQTAPGDGICIKGRLTTVQNCRDVVIRYIRSRAGDVNCPNFEDDSFHFVNATNCIADHVSSTWSIDEAFSCTWSTNITIQWCIIGESLRNSCHSKGAHGYGTLLRYGAGAVSFHHNLYAHNSSRNPRLGDRIRMDFVNNVLYNWGGTCGYNANDSPDNLAIPAPYFTNAANYISNYFIAGPSSSGSIAFDSGVTNSTSCQIYQSGNIMDSNKDGQPNGANTGWSMFGSPYTQLGAAFTAPAVTTDTPQIAYERVLALVGASQSRDAVDSRIIRTARTQTGRLIDYVNTTNAQTTDYVTNGTFYGVAGWPTLNSTTAPTDTDQDGIPNYFELAMSWSTSVANNNHTNSDGYTDLEWYLNWLADPHAPCDRNGFTDVSLRALTGGSTNLTYSVANGTNGTVSLLGDGFTARFVATNNYTGFASFTFTATDPTNSVSFSATASILVTTTNVAPANTPPMLTTISNRTVMAGVTLAFTNAAGDTDSPAQTLTFSLANAPAGVAVNSSNGIFNWRPTIAQSPATNSMSVVVTDNGTPNMSATQNFSVTVNKPSQPLIQNIALGGGQFSLRVSGDAGPDYTVLASTNLADWTNIFTTNSPALPFNWSDTSASNFFQRYFRLQLGP